MLLRLPRSLTPSPSPVYGRSEDAWTHAPGFPFSPCGRRGQGLRGSTRPHSLNIKGVRPSPSYGEGEKTFLEYTAQPITVYCLCRIELPKANRLKLAVLACGTIHRQLSSNY